MPTGICRELHLQDVQRNFAYIFFVENTGQFELKFPE